MLRDDCQCGHARDSHHTRTTVRPPPSDAELDVVVRVYGLCLAPWCDCKQYEAPHEH